MAVVAKRTLTNNNGDGEVGKVDIVNKVNKVDTFDKAKDPTKDLKLVAKKRKATAKNQDQDSKTVIKALKKITAESDFGKLFNLAENNSLVNQYLRVYSFNQRLSLAKTKTRGEVAGSGRKPWKQKHTGRARVGSVRNPVWRHGGVAHGPVFKDWSLDLPKNMKKTAFATILSKRLISGNVYEVDKITLQEGRTKEALELLKSWGLVGNVLLLLGEANSQLVRACGNLKNVEVVLSANLNGYQLMKHKNIVFEKSALDKIKDNYAKNN